MRRALVSLVVAMVTAAVGTAAAQPGQTAPGPPAPRQPYIPPPYAYQPQPVQLTVQEAAILERGKIDLGTHVLGAGAAYMIGFGSGQAIQGRWSDTGWIFTLGEGASVVALIASIDQWDSICDRDGYCRDEVPGLFVVGIVGLAVFRVWGMVDAIAGPVVHNRSYRKLRQRLGYPPDQARATPYLAPAARGDGGVAGVTFRF